MKEFKTNEELLEILKSKNVKINDDAFALTCLSNYSYYSVINTYKLIFKDNDNYKGNVCFEEIFSLYEFDKKLKNIFMKNILDIESVVKTKIANIFGEKHGIDNYLIPGNFNSDIDQKNNTNYIGDLISAINEEINKNNGKHEAVTHYMNKYGFVPPWVLMKIISLGTISKFYGLMKQDDKQIISKCFGLSDNYLKSILGSLTAIRNICAHDDRLYSYRNTFFINVNRIFNKKIVEIGKINYTTIYVVIISMKKLLSSEKYDMFLQELKSCFVELQGSLTSINIDDIKRVMGIPITYNFE